MLRLPVLTRTSFLAVAVAALAFTAPVRADYDLTYDGNVAGENVTFNYKGNSEAAFAGQYYMHLNGQASNSLLTFCVDLTHWATVGQTYPVIPSRLSTSGLPAAGEIAYLINTYGAKALSDNEQAAGLQVAIWKLLVDGASSTDVTSGGNFQYTAGDSTLIADANGFLKDGASQSADATYLQEDLTGQTVGQGMATASPVVPEPGSAVLLGVGFVGLLGYARFRRRSSILRLA